MNNEQIRGKIISLKEAIRQAEEKDRALWLDKPQGYCGDTETNESELTLIALMNELEGYKNLGAGI